MRLNVLPVVALCCIHSTSVCSATTFGSLHATTGPTSPIVFRDKNVRLHIGEEPVVPFSLDLSPEPLLPVKINWRVIGDAFTITESASTFPGQLPELKFRSQGHATLVATTSATPATVISQVIFAYNSVYLGCTAWTAAHGIAFDQAGLAEESESPEKSDLYVTAPHCAYWGSDSSPFDASGDAMIHVPGGGVALTIPSKGFEVVRQHDWQNVTTTVGKAEVQGHKLLLFKTRDGRVVKLLLTAAEYGSIDGPYAVAPTNGAFFDETEIDRLHSLKAFQPKTQATTTYSASDSTL